MVVCFENETAVGCGAFKSFDEKTAEVKRMFVHDQFRNRGLGKMILTELEAWAAELNYSSSILETGKGQTEAIALYTKAGYEIIPNFGQYRDVENSVCMMKRIGV